MKRIVCVVLAVFALQMTVYAEDSAFDTSQQFDALGKEELMEQVPEDAKSLMEQADVYELSVDKLLQLSPRDFFRTIWETFVYQLQKPLRTLATVMAIIILCALLDGMKTAVGENTLSQLFSTVAVLCILASVIVPILDCIINTSKAVKDAALFMLSFIPMFSAALAAAGQPITSATYNLFLFSTCQIVSQVVSQTLIPLMGIYLALCIVGSVVPELNMSSAASTIKSTVSWVLGFILTVFVGLLSVQTMVAQGADSVATKTTKFLIGSFVPVVGSALSEAFTAAQGCLRLIKTSMGAYGIIVAVFTFLPILLQTMIWYLLTNLAVVAGDIIGVPKVSSILKSCSGVLGILIAVILCFALLIIVSTTVVMVTGMGVG